MNLTLWIAQWVLAGFFVFWAVLKFARAALEDNAMREIDAKRRGWAHVTRGIDVVNGLIFAICGVALVSPAIPLRWLHHPRVVPIAALMLLLRLIWLHRRFGHGDWTEGLVGVLMFAIAVLRAGT
jgi:hypothetical protein